MEFRKLRSDEIQVRPTDTKNKGRATLLLYQDARVVMDILDDVVGKENWQKEYYEVKGNVYCRIGIRTETGEWIWKADCGTESNVDAEKGEASDAFKRAAVSWGIGRELYATPKIKVNIPDSYYYNDKMTMTFTVKDITWGQDTTLESLVIVDKFGKEVYNYKKASQTEGKENVQMSQSKQEVLKNFCSEKKAEEGVDVPDLVRFYEWYIKRAENWDGPFKPDVLYNKWCQTKRG